MNEVKLQIHQEGSNRRFTFVAKVSGFPLHVLEQLAAEVAATHPVVYWGSFMVARLNGGNLSRDEVARENILILVGGSLHSTRSAFHGVEELCTLAAHRLTPQLFWDVGVTPRRDTFGVPKDPLVTLERFFFSFPPATAG